MKELKLISIWSLGFAALGVSGAWAMPAVGDRYVMDVEIHQDGKPTQFYVWQAELTATDGKNFTRVKSQGPSESQLTEFSRVEVPIEELPTEASVQNILDNCLRYEGKWETVTTSQGESIRACRIGVSFGTEDLGFAWVAQNPIYGWAKADYTVDGRRYIGTIRSYHYGSQPASQP